MLILDEPTNDLDLETLDLLEDLISSYQGTVIVISHDRRFIDKVATETWVFEGNGKIETVVGGWSDVLAYYSRIGKVYGKGAVKENKNSDKKTSDKVKSKKSGLSFTEEHELQSLPEKVEKLEDEITRLDEALLDPNLYSEGADKAIALNNERNEKSSKLDELYARWEELETKAQETL